MTLVVAVNQRKRQKRRKKREEKKEQQNSEEEKLVFTDCLSYSDFHFAAGDIVPAAFFIWDKNENYGCFSRRT